MGWKTKRNRFKGKDTDKNNDDEPINIDQLLALFPDEGAEATDGTVTPASVWAVGDRCFVRGLTGLVDTLGDECASVTIPGTRRMLFVGLDELASVTERKNP